MIDFWWLWLRRSRLLLSPMFGFILFGCGHSGYFPWVSCVVWMACELCHMRMWGHCVDDLHITPRLLTFWFAVLMICLDGFLLMRLQGCSFSSMSGFSHGVFQHRGFNEVWGISCPARIAATLMGFSLFDARFGVV